MFKLTKSTMIWLIVTLLLVVAGLAIYKSMFSERHAATHYKSMFSGRHAATHYKSMFSGRHAATATHIRPHASGQATFGALSKISRILERENTDWNKVDMDALWEHLKNMNSLMLHTNIEKQELSNGLVMNVSGDANAINAINAMNEMIPAHSNFLTTVRPEWDISFKKTEKGYSIRVTSEQKSQVEKIKALGFSGFMVQDDHHASHHLRIASGDQVHTPMH